MVTKLRFGQGNPDAATDAADADATADQNNLYMSPSQATQNVREHNIKVLDEYLSSFGKLEAREFESSRFDSACIKRFDEQT